jgi:hypothetical protein
MVCESWMARRCSSPAGGRWAPRGRVFPLLQLAPRLMHGWPSFDCFFWLLALGLRALPYYVRTSGAGEKEVNE